MVRNRTSERARIEKSFDVFSVSAEHRALIIEALNSTEWDWFADCDGCTAVSELHWPTKYFPPCLRHDFDWMRGRGDWEASCRFYLLQRAYGVSGLAGGAACRGGNRGVVCLGTMGLVARQAGT